MEFDEQYVVDDFFIGAKLPENICIVPINSSIIFVFKLLFYLVSIFLLHFKNHELTSTISI